MAGATSIANQSGGTAEEDLVQWTAGTDLPPHPQRIMQLPSEDRVPQKMLASAYEDSDFEKMEEIRAWPRRS